MSRIQDILSKAERDGTARRTRSLGDEYGSRPAANEAVGRALVEPPPAPRTTPSAGPTRVTPEPLDVPEPRRSARALRTEGRGAVAPETVAPAQRPMAPDVPPERREFRTGPAASVGSVAAARVTPVAEDSDARAIGALDEHLVAALAPTSLAAEQYRSLRTRLKQTENGRVLRSIAITSPNKGDGKSLTAANLALTMAQEYQQRVLLIDADLRRPTVHSLFGLNEAPGLVDVVMNEAELDHALVFLPEQHLTVLPAGLPPAQPAELLGSAAMRRLLETLRTRFDRILIDVPPVAPLADLHILTPMLDGVLMIVRAGVTPKPAIERALSGVDPSKVLGLVLNEAGSEGGEAYNYEGYGYVAG